MAPYRASTRFPGAGWPEPEPEPAPEEIVFSGSFKEVNRFFYETDAGEAVPPLVSKVTDVRLRRNRKVRLETPGGGGFGDPATRDRALVRRDLQRGYYDRPSIKALFGIDPDQDVDQSER